MEGISGMKHIVMRSPSFVVKLWFWSEELTLSVKVPATEHGIKASSHISRT